MLRRFVAMPLALAVMTALALPASVSAQAAAQAQTDDDTRRGGSISINGSVSDGTQSQTAVTLLLALAIETGLDPAKLHSQTRFRGDVAHGTAKKPGQSRITSAEMLYGELRHSVDARQAISLLRGSLTPRDSRDAATRVWLYGVASGYHHIAFGLRAEQAYGGGVAVDVAAIPGLAVAADLRHMNETFDGQPSFASWGVRVHESWSKTWVLDAGTPQMRFLTIAESIEIVPAFASADALQSRAFVQVKLPITSQFYADLTLGHDYLRNAAPTFQRRYWKSAFGIGYAFGSTQP